MPVQRQRVRFAPRPLVAFSDVGRQQPEQCTSRMAADFRTPILEQCLERLFSRLLRGEAGPLVIPHFSGPPGMPQVALRLSEPIHRSAGHVRSIPTRMTIGKTRSGRPGVSGAGFGRAAGLR